MHCGALWENIECVFVFSCVCGIGVILMDAFVERYSAFSVVSVADPILLLGFFVLFGSFCLFDCLILCLFVCLFVLSD